MAHPADMMAPTAVSERRSSGWEPIDTAPRDGTTILLFSPDASFPQIMIGFWATFVDKAGIVQAAEWSDIWAGCTIDVDPTHWCPLPETPKPTLGAASPRSSADDADPAGDSVVSRGGQG